MLLGAGVASLAVVAGLALVLRARGPLETARSAMLQGRDAVSAGDLTGARDAFTRAEAAFAEARSSLSNPFTRLASWVPLLGRTPDAVGDAAEAGLLMARAGGQVTGAAEGLPGGLGALAPREETIPLEPLRSVAPALALARDLAGRAEALLEEAPRSLVPAVVTEPLEDFTVEASRAHRALVSAAAMAGTLPGFLGADGPKRYFFGAQNPAELRGTGGLIGAFAILTATEGHIEVGPFRDVQRLKPADVSTLSPPNPDYETLYGTNYQDMSNINMTPDFPSAATAIEQLYRAATGEPVDGTVVADPQALAYLLGAAGPAEVPATGTTVDADSVVDFVANEAYAVLPDDDARKRLLGEVAAGVLARFLGSGAAADPAAAGRAVVEAAAGGHLLLHSADPRLQHGLEVAGVAGALVDPAGDYLAVIGNNAGGNKIDFYARRTLRYEVVLLADGAARGRLAVTIDNDAPSRGQPQYVIGPHPFVDAEAGDSITNVQTYCRRGCRFEDLRLNGQTLAAAPDIELGHPLVTVGLGIPSQRSGRLEYAWTAPRAWHEEGGMVVYRLTVQGEPTIVPTRLELSVAIPENADVARVSPGMHVGADRVTWTGEPGDLTTFEVAFRRPFPAGILGHLS
ncbi:MAG: DUF4012 domain-containing protein [Actinomycetota bacterium]